MFEYTPYGETLTAEGPGVASMPFRYSSEYCDGDLGLIYYNYRHYNPQDERWISRDIIGEEGEENLYNFVNNSINLFDKNGLKWDVVCTEKLDCPEPVPGLGSGRGRVVYGEKESLTYAVKELNRDGKICYKLELNGTLTLKLEMLDRKHDFFAFGRFSRFDKKWGVPRSNNLEWQAVRTHERDHRNTFTKEICIKNIRLNINLKNK